MGEGDGERVRKGEMEGEMRWRGWGGWGEGWRWRVEGGEMEGGGRRRRWRQGGEGGNAGI